MKKTLEQLKYRIENNKYFTTDHVRSVIREVGELNEEDCTVAHLLELAQGKEWLGKVDDAGFYPSIIFDPPPEPLKSCRVQENRLWLMGAVPVGKVRR
jgi:hypothetical protein